MAASTTEAMSADLEVDAGDVSSSKELDMVLVLVDRVVVDAGILAGVPVKHKLTIVQPTNALLATYDAQVAFLQLSNNRIPMHQ